MAMYHANRNQSTPDVRPYRYQVFAVADVECISISGDALRSFQDLADAKHFAAKVTKPFGAAVLDIDTGAIDFSRGFGVEIEAPEEEGR